MQIYHELILEYIYIIYISDKNKLNIHYFERFIFYEKIFDSNFFSENFYFFCLKIL